MSIVEILKVLCKQHGISIPKLENELGFGHGSIYNWDSNIPGIDRVQKVAKRFGVSVDFLLSGKEMRIPFTSETLMKIASENGENIGSVISVLDEVKSKVLADPINLRSEVVK